ncbi:SPO22-domain-containing protein [Aulographum hederae CBS 113979]|uniref:Protein ZIP4 homolog n=1 Tax=Aulographum hederae CBS 113979 TaxID=1176131 RepID=A0A6G1H704_9PEZI|nr:SPO22-domain-containing protein [Aulographum hederae CBS 113979]
MPPSRDLRTEKEKRIKALLNFVDAVPNRVSSDKPDPSLTPELLAHIKSLPLPLPSTSTSLSIAKELDEKGTALWNHVTRLRRKDDALGDKRTLSLLRVFAFLVLDCGQQQQSSHKRKDDATSAKAKALMKVSASNGVRLLKVGLKAATACLDIGELESCTRALERAAVWQDVLDKSEGNGRDEDVKGRLCSEYFVLRTALAWKQDRLDLTEHWFSKITKQGETLDPQAAEKLADLLFEIGKDQMAKKNYEWAAKWLERAYDVLAEQELENLSEDSAELNMSIIQKLIRAFVAQDNDEARVRAWDLVTLMEQDYADKMVVWLLKLELLSSDRTTDPAAYYTVLQRMIRSAVLTQPNFKTMMYHIRKFKDKDPHLACKAIDELLIDRLCGQAKEESIESAAMTRIWITLTTSENADAVSSLNELFENLNRGLERPFTSSATHAAQTLIWNRIESTYSQNHFDMAESWCSLAAHPLFEQCGELNQAKLARKLILCALGRHNLDAAREHWFRMTDVAKSAPITRYLMFKVAVRSQDDALATDCLKKLSKTSSKDATLLYACVVDALQVGNQKEALLSLQTVLKKYDYNAPEGVHLPALLRTTGRLMVNGLKPEDVANDVDMAEVCRLFEGAAVQATRSLRQAEEGTSSQFTPEELDWFSKNSYNLCLKFCTDMHPSYLSRMLICGIKFIDLLIPLSDSEQQEGLELRRTFCSFLTACANITLARSEDNIEYSLQNYTAVREHARDFRAQVAKHVASTTLTTGAKADLKAKYMHMIKFELEAALKLSKWEDLDGLFRDCWTYDDSSTSGGWDTLADLILIVHAEAVNADVESSHLRIDRSMKTAASNNNSDPINLSRWLRCIFQIGLGIDETISLDCLDKAYKIANAAIRASQNHTQSQAQASIGQSYPEEELEWLASTSYNKAVDAYCADDDEMCRTWAEKALMLAEAGGEALKGLSQLLREKYSGLRWDK